MTDDGLVWFGPASMTMELYQDLPKHQRNKVLVNAFLSRHEPTSPNTTNVLHVHDTSTIARE